MPIKHSRHIQRVSVNEPAYVTWEGKLTDNPDTMSYMSKALGEYRALNTHVKAAYSDSYRYSRDASDYDYSDLASNVSGRPGFTRRDYEAFRPNEALPTDIKDIIAKSCAIYQRVGLIRNIIDLMGDFGSQGIRLTHPNKKIQRFYSKWFERVRGEERSERFLNNLYRSANVVIRVQTAQISKKDSLTLDRAFAQPDLQMRKLDIKKGEIPIRYTFLNPITIDVIGGSLSSFIGNPQYVLRIPSQLRRIINSPSTTDQKELVSKLPLEIREAAKTSHTVKLPKDKTRVFHYKKDDWQDWARPMIYAIMTDINILEKMKLADTAALDGAISHVRVFKLGSLEHKIAPTQAAASKLAEILESNVGGGTMDLIWGPDLELLESKSEVYKFLGEEKFKPHLNNIYAGLGIPPTLTGTFGASGTTNNFISLKTLMQRLEYGRKQLNQFWLLEIKKVQLAMDFRFPAKIEYDIDNLGDETAEKSLLIQLADRNLISDELLQYRFGHDPDLEKIRLNRESRERDTGTMVAKSSPWHDPQIGLSLKRTALQKGSLTPGQVGLQKDARRREMKIFDQNKEDPAVVDPNKSSPQIKNKDQQENGRPKNSRDTQKRKKKEFIPKTRAELEIWLEQSYKDVASIINPLYVKSKNKKDMRQLTATEMKEVEHFRFETLLKLQPLQKVDQQVLNRQFSVIIPDSVYFSYYKCINDIENSLDRNLTISERQKLQSQFYINFMGDFHG